MLVLPLLRYGKNRSVPRADPVNRNRGVRSYFSLLTRIHIVSAGIYKSARRLGALSIDFETYGIGMKATAQKPMTVFPHAIPRSLNIGSTAIGMTLPKRARTKSLDARADAAYLGYAEESV
jgi:hypothetical protein